MSDARTPDARHETALERFKLAAEADKGQRDRELEDLKFVDDPDGQWPEDIRTQRKGGTFGSITVPARPCLTVDKVSPAIDQVLNQAQNSRLAVKIKPKGSKASQKTAEMLQGLYRNIENESRAQIARVWALDRATKCGRGVYRINTRYANDGDFDLDITIDRILNQHSVYLDPFHQQPDASDIEWAFIVEDVPVRTYKRLYSKRKDGDPSELADLDDDALRGVGDESPGWIGGDDAASRTIRVAEYFYREYTTEKLVLRSDGTMGLESQLPKAGKGVTVVREREVDVPSVKWCKLNCVEILDEEDWNGRYIPIVQVLGKEHNINGTRRYSGIVNKAKDAQRVYNVMLSREMETIGLASSAPWLLEEGSIEGYEQMWQNAALRNLPYLFYKRTNLAQKEATPPTRNVAEPPIQAIAHAIRQASEDIQATTRTFDPSLGKAQGKNQSGRAIAELQQQAEQGNSNYLENLASIAMNHEARIVLDMAKYVYDKPGRIVQILSEDEKPSEVMLNQPFTKGPEGKPVPAELPPGAPLPPDHEHFDLTEGEYTVTVSVGKSFSTSREESNAMMGQLAEAAPQMVPMFADLWVRSMDFPGKDQIADRLMPPGADKESGKAEDPRIAQLEMQLQQAMQELQQAKSGIAQAQIKAESAEKIKGAELSLKAQIEAQKAELERLKLMVEANMQQQKIDADREADVRQAALAEQQAQHQAEQAERDRQHADLHKAVDLSHQERMSDAEHVQQQTLAKMKPAPAKGKK